MKKIAFLLVLLMITSVTANINASALEEGVEQHYYKNIGYFILSDGNICISSNKNGNKNGIVEIPEKINGRKVVEVQSVSLFIDKNTAKLIIPRYVKLIDDFSYSPHQSGVKFSVAKNNKKYCSYKGMLMSKSKKTLYAIPYNGKTTVTVPSSVVNIGSEAFCDYKNSDINENLTIKLPKGLKKIGSEAFMGIASLHSIKLPKKLEKICSCAFLDSLITYKAPQNDTDNDTYYNTEIKIPKSVSYIGHWAIGYSSHGKVNSGLIKGKKYSAAYWYAKANKFDFKAE